MSLEGRTVEPFCVFSLTCLHFSDLLQGLHGPPGDKGNRVSLTPCTLALVTNVFMMWWNDQVGISDLTRQIQFFLINHHKLKGFIVRGLIPVIQGA